MAFTYTAAKKLDNYTSAPYGMFFRPDGLKMYYCGKNSSSYYSILECDLSAAWDITTLSVVANIPVYSKSDNPQDVFFSPDGLIMFVLGYNSTNKYCVARYNLSVAWSVATAVFSTAKLLNSTKYQLGLFFNPDGTKMYVVNDDYYGNVLIQYSLSAAWDITTAVSSFASNAGLFDWFPPKAISINNSGTECFILTLDTVQIIKFSLTTPWDLSTHSVVGAAWEDSPPNGLTEQGIFLKEDTSKLFITGYSTVVSGPAVVYYEGETPIPPVSIFWTNFHGLREEI